MDDSYIFCIQCKEFVLEFCSIHGPSLIIPDSKPALNDPPSRISRAALTIPQAFLHLAPSNKSESGVGVFSSIKLDIGIRFGPFRGVYSDTTSSMRCWLIHNTHKSYIIDGGDPNKSNWMRYVNCSQHFSEQNLLAYQHNGQIYYCTIKPIPSFTELLVFYGTDFANLLNIDLRKYDKPINLGGKTYTAKTVSLYKNMPIDNKQEVCSNSIYSQSDIEKYPEKTKKYIQKPDSTKSMFSCEICERKFNVKNYLTRHKRTHLNKKRYQCPYCNYESNENYTLNAHINATHTKEIAYTCNICFKHFYVKKNYKRHQRIHLNK